MKFTVTLFVKLLGWACLLAQLIAKSDWENTNVAMGGKRAVGMEYRGERIFLQYTVLVEDRLVAEMLFVEEISTALGRADGLGCYFGV